MSLFHCVIGSIILSTGEVVASMISPDFATIFGIFINLVSISGNIHNTFSLLHEIRIEIRKTFRK